MKVQPVKQEPVKLTPWLLHSRRLRLDKRIYWQHHRGGWRHVVELMTEHLHDADGTRLLTTVEDELFVKGPYFAGPITEPWVGFIHQMPRQYLNFPDLERLVQTDVWKKSIEYCQGLWTLSEYQKRFLLEHDPSLKIAKVYYPVAPANVSFSLEKFLRAGKRKLVFIGEFLRRYQPFFDLHTPPDFEKILLRSAEVDTHIQKQKVVENDSVTSRYDLSDAEYDQLLGESIVFLNLFDAGAVTTIVECIASGTPVLINPVGAVVEYLGEDYPFYYETLEEAATKAADLDLIKETAEYMRSNPLKEQLTDAHFLQALQNTTVYRELPVPRNEQYRFRTFDVSLVICSYKRVYNLRNLLTRLVDQDFTGTYEVLLWNNNIETVNEVSEICRPFADRLSLKLMHSTENFYCQIRPAMASLIRSDLILICDDDVLPARNYISTFVAKYQQYGPEAVICARGHVFLPHELNESEPQRFWSEYKSMQFYDESKPDRKIHFVHADNCLIPKSIMKRALQYDMPRYDFMLIDDYWLSYVFSEYLNVPIWKVKMDECLTMTECADDTSIALFHNPLVNEQRVNFYIYHMRHGWPGSNSKAGSAEVKIAKPGAATARKNDFQELVHEILSREKLVSPKQGFFLRLSAAVVRQQEFFVHESPRERELLQAEWDELATQYGSFKVKEQALLDYMDYARQELNAACIDETVVKTAWEHEEVSEYTLSLPATLSTETKRYLKWVTRSLQGCGEVVELGSWLGAATLSLAEGMTTNPAVAGRQINAFDSFQWRNWMYRFVGPRSRAKFPKLSLLKRADDFFDLYLELCEPYKHLIQANRFYVSDDTEEDSSFESLDWNGQPIELLVYNLSNEYYLIEKIWEVFSPSFIPGKTILAVNTYGDANGGIRDFFRAHASKVKPIHKPASYTKGFLYTG